MDETDEPPRRRPKVVDLVAALQASVDKAKQAAERAQAAKKSA